MSGRDEWLPWRRDWSKYRNFWKVYAAFAVLFSAVAILYLATGNLFGLYYVTLGAIWALFALFARGRSRSAAEFGQGDDQSH